MIKKNKKTNQETFSKSIEYSNLKTFPVNFKEIVNIKTIEIHNN